MEKTKRFRPIDILKAPNKLKVNPLQFMNPSTPEACYLLGFLWADGYLGSNYCICSEIVSEDAASLASVFNATGAWNRFIRKRGDHRETTKLTCSSKLLYSYLQGYGYGNNNQSPNKILSTIPQNLTHYWYLGYCDGDGCFYYNRKNYIRHLSFASCYDQDWSFLDTLFQRLDISHYHITRDENTTKAGKINRSSHFRCANRDGIRKFGEYIYQNRTFGLNRKFTKYQQVIT